MTNSGGDSNGIRGFIRDVEVPLYTYALRLVRNRTDAEDIAHEALSRLLRLAREGRLKSDDAARRALAFTVVYSLAMDLQRTKRWMAEPTEDPNAASNRPLAQALAQQQLDMSLDELPGVHRHALLLRVFGELRYVDIAHALSVDETQVRTWVYRARVQLTELLDADGQYIGGTLGEQDGDD
jgi:RNA polymerase sigma factor (sigma-70 family)